MNKGTYHKEDVVTLKEFVEAYSKRLGIPYETARTCYLAFCATLAKYLVEEDRRVLIRGLFSIHPHTVHNKNRKYAYPKDCNGGEPRPVAMTYRQLYCNTVSNMRLALVENDDGTKRDYSDMWWNNNYRIL